MNKTHTHTKNPPKFRNNSYTTVELLDWNENIEKLAKFFKMCFCDVAPFRSTVFPESINQDQKENHTLLTYPTER